MFNSTKVSYQPEVRFGDIDVMGHVNNAVYLSYFEQARMNYFHTLIRGDWDWNEDGVLLARNEVDYKLPVELHDKINIDVWVADVGNKSFSMNYKVSRHRDGAITTVGKSILVCYNYKKHETQPIPESWLKVFG